MDNINKVILSPAIQMQLRQAIQMEIKDIQVPIRVIQAQTQAIQAKTQAIHRSQAQTQAIHRSQVQTQAINRNLDTRHNQAMPNQVGIQTNREVIQLQVRIHHNQICIHKFQMRHHMVIQHPVVSWRIFFWFYFSFTHFYQTKYEDWNQN